MALILGIETSCDETAAAVVSSEGAALDKILSNVVYSQLSEHSVYGGIVPEVAARAHIDFLFPVIQRALDDAKVSLTDIDAMAATCGPGLIGGLLVGAIASKTFALVHKKPFIAINHLEAHIQICRLSNDIQFPYLALLISGGHCQFLEVYGLNHCKMLGQTVDDSAGEILDKIARLLGLGYPGGPIIERLAKEGDPNRFTFPVPLKGRPGCNLSFSGLKTAFRLLIQKISPLSEQDVKDVAACLQNSIAESLANRAKNAILMASRKIKEGKTFVLTGGVAANFVIRNKLKSLCDGLGFNLVTIPPSLCTDNAAMIAWTGLCYHLKKVSHSLDFETNPRWRLDAEKPLLGCRKLTREVRNKTLAKKVSSPKRNTQNID